MSGVQVAVTFMIFYGSCCCVYNQFSSQLFVCVQEKKIVTKYNVDIMRNKERQDRFNSNSELTGCLHFHSGGDEKTI